MKKNKKMLQTQHYGHILRPMLGGNVSSPPTAQRLSKGSNVVSGFSHLKLKILYAKVFFLSLNNPQNSEIIFL
jgi:hypothetical protein